MGNSKYSVILADLEEKIASGTLQPGDSLPTENEFMRTYQVSRTTVLRALNILVSKGIIYRVPGRGSFVSEKVTSHGNSSANEPIGGTYAIILPKQEATILQYLVGAQEYFEQHDAKLIVRFSKETYESDIGLIASLMKDNVDGILIYPSDSTDSKHFYKKLPEQNIPVILLDKLIVGANLSSVTSDNYMIGRLVAERFLKSGFRNFAFTSEVFTSGTTVLSRFRGYADKLRQHGIRVNREDVIILPSDFNQRDRIFEEYFTRKRDRKTAIFCVFDELAVHVYRGAAKAGAEIPKDLAVIGCDDLAIASALFPALTTVEQPYQQIGYEAARLAMYMANSPEYSVWNIQIPVRMVERASVTQTV